MLLAVDTASRWASVALYDETGLISEFNWRCTSNHTAEVMPTIDLMIRQAHSQIENLEAVATARGPGSFTGLRIGMSIAKGLCLALDIPIITIPTLDIIAYATGDPGNTVYAVLEIGRGRICVGQYLYQDGLPVAQEEPTIYSEQDWRPDIGSPVVITGDISVTLAERLLAQPDADKIAISSLASSARRAGYLAELAWMRMKKGQLDDLDTISPVYLHQPGSGGQRE